MVVFSGWLAEKLPKSLVAKLLSPRFSDDGNDKWQQLIEQLQSGLTDLDGRKQIMVASSDDKVPVS